MKEKLRVFIKKFSRLSLPIAIIIASIILGGFFYASQVSKQRSIEKQQQIKIEQEQQAKEETEQALNTCIANAEKEAQRVNQSLLDYAKTLESNN